MRVTFCPGPGLPELDLELAAGVTVAAMRKHLAAATGSRAATVEDLAVGAIVLDDSHLTGTFPLVAGARLRIGAAPSADDGVLAAVRTQRHLAVLAGPDAGLLWPAGGRLEIGRGRGHADSDRLVLVDPLVSTRHLGARVALGRVWLRELGSANGSRRSRRWSRHRVTAPVPRWWSRWRDGDRVTVGTTVLELRGPAPRSARPRGRRALVAVAALGPALGSLALVAGTGNPTLLMLGLAGPALATLIHRGTPPDRETTDSSDDDAAWTGEDVVAADLADVAVRALLTGRDTPADGVIERLAPTGTLAVCGPGAREVAATIVLAARPVRLDVHGPGSGSWSWSHWLRTTPDADAAGPEVVVFDGGEPSPAGAGPGRVVVLVDPPRVPSWCTARLDTTTGRWSGPDDDLDVVVLPGSAAWAARQARLLAGIRSVQAAGDGGLPESVTLGGLGLSVQPGDVAAAWRGTDAGLRAVLGAGQGGGVVVDLVREGPHALVAGTTGSGKSEALRALIASLALRYPPTALAFALVDFKGGAGFGALSALPHVVGTVTDLDAHEAARAIGGLAAELRARKAQLARVGVTDLRDWPAEADEPYPGRLVVVIDEFRALAEELPDLMSALVRVATQGRSLGVHLVLATQRPSGVVSAELRANVALRLALRVTDAGDSSDVIDVPDAAAIPPSLPGRALLRRGPGPIEEIQIALVGAGTPPVRLADEPVSVAEAGPEPDEELVATLLEAAKRWYPQAPRPTAPWLPALSDDVTVADLETIGSTAAPPTGSPPSNAPATGELPGTARAAEPLPLALADEPATQSRSVVSWDPRAGHLLAIGGPGSGRSTLLETIGTAALARGWAVHTVGLPDGATGPGSPLGGHPGLGTVCDAADARRLARLVTLLAAAPERTMLLIDGVERAWQSLESVARGDGTSRFVELLRARTVGIVMTASGPSGPWAGHANDRLVLPVGDTTAEELAGVPRTLSGGRRAPGRAVWLPARSDALVCQVARSPRGATAAPTHPGSAHPVPAHPGSPPVRLAPIPLVTTRPDTGRRRRLIVGLGGDAAVPLGLDATAGGLVVGPPGSGRSTALAHLVLSATQLGLTPVTIARDGPVLAAAAAHGRAVAVERDAVLAALERREPHDAVVVDDLDALVRLLPDVADALDDLVDEGVALFASLTTTAALSAYRGAVATLRGKRQGLVLGAHTPGSDDVLGSPLAWHIDPARPAHPGRGVLQRGSRLDPVQAFAPQ